MVGVGGTVVLVVDGGGGDVEIVDDVEVDVDDVVVEVGAVVAVVVVVVVDVVGAVVVVVVVDVVEVVVVGGGKTPSVRTVMVLGTARRWEPGAEYVRSGPGAEMVATTGPLTPVEAVIVATPLGSVGAWTWSEPSSNVTTTPPIGPPGPVRRTAMVVPPSPPAVIAGLDNVHGPWRAVASAASAVTAASMSARRPPSITAISTRSPRQTEPPPARWAPA